MFDDAWYVVNILLESDFAKYINSSYNLQIRSAKKVISLGLVSRITITSCTGEPVLTSRQFSVERDGRSEHPQQTSQNKIIPVSSFELVQCQEHLSYLKIRSASNLRTCSSSYCEFLFFFSDYISTLNCVLTHQTHISTCEKCVSTQYHTQHQLIH